MIEDAFTALIGHAMARSAFVPPAVNEVRTIVFESATFAGFVEGAERCLDLAEAERASRFRFEQDRITYTLAHAVWRVAISLCLDTVPAEVPLTMTPSGQPRLSGTRFSTSLSHTSHWIAIAIGHGETVGIDIEQTPPRAALANMVDTICTPGEKARIMPLTNAARELALLVLWTRKEALLKAFGVGLGVDPATVMADTDELVCPPPAARDQSAVRILGLDLPPGLVGALALPADVLLVGQHRLELECQT